MFKTKVERIIRFPGTYLLYSGCDMELIELVEVTFHSLNDVSKTHAYFAK